MKKGDRVYISKDAKYNGQDMEWTERITGTITLYKGQKLYHSSDSKLKAFYPKETCFFMNTYAEGYVYCAILNKEITIPCYDNEVRIDLSYFSNDDIEIYYIGTRKYDKFIPYNPNYPQFGYISYKNNVLKKYDISE